MIEKFKDVEDRLTEDEFFGWADGVIYNMRKTEVDEDKLVPFGLTFDVFEDNLYINPIDNGIVITLEEGTHDTTDSRDQNIEFIKKFVAQEMPYLEFNKIEEHYDDYFGWGFEMEFIFKEVEQ